MSRRRVSSIFLILAFVLAIATGPIGYCGQIVRDEDPQ